MSDPYHIPLGIEPHAKEAAILGQPSLEEMRIAINQGRRDSALVNNCLNQADYHGWSGEDKYVGLAYHALVMLEQLHKRVMSILQRSPLPPITVSSPFAAHLSMATKWEEGPPRAPGSYVVQYSNEKFSALTLVANCQLLLDADSYNVKRHFRFYP